MEFKESEGERKWKEKGRENSYAFYIKCTKYSEIPCTPIRNYFITYDKTAPCYTENYVPLTE